MAEIHYHVDHELQKTEREELTAREILRDANINPDEYYLVEVKGVQQFHLRITRIRNLNA